MYGDKIPPDIDVYEIGHTLQRGFIKQVLCEGCEMIGVSKNSAGEIVVMYEDFGPDGPEIKSIPVSEWNSIPILVSNKNNELSPTPAFLGQIANDSIRIKIIEGIPSVPPMYHVIKEYLDRKETEYSYLTEKQLLDKHQIVVKEKFEWAGKQKIFS